MKKIALRLKYKNLGFYTFVWSNINNTYLLLDKQAQLLLDIYIKSEKKNDFIEELEKSFKTSDSESIYKDLKLFHKQLLQVSDSEEMKITDFNNKNCIVHNYTYKNQGINISFPKELPLIYCLNKISHLFTEDYHSENVHFELYTSVNCNIAFKKNNTFIGAWQKTDLNKFEGKFAFELLNTIHKKTEQDWVGTFHASSIGNGEQAVMLVGNSGSGKSTLATLLMYAGYDLIADDMSAMLLENNHIAVLPAALSVKEKAFETIAPLVDNFEDLPTQYINTKKGRVTYVPPLPLKHPKKLNYPCKNIVLVRYNHSPIPTTLTEGAEKTILEELITESWLAHNEAHAQSFLNWLGTIKFYELKYHNNDEAIDAVDSLF